MRLDRYLASSRILKSRSLVKKAVDEGMVFVNANPAKSSLTVKLGDIIEVDIPRFYKKLKVMEMPYKNMKKSDVGKLFELLEDRRKELF